MHEIFQKVRQEAEKDAAMLESMAMALRMDLQFSFNKNDMADLLDKVRENHYAHLTR
jgi:hypothetical protein